MHYIRFLKTPKVHVDRSIVSLKAVIAITTDLGETFYPDDLDLIVTVQDPSPDGDIFLRRRVQWEGGCRALPVSFNLSYQDVDWPACMHVTVKDTNHLTKVSTNDSEGFMPPIVPIWSGTMNPVKGEMEAGHRVERRFTSLSERTVSLLEDAGDSIARHLWDGSQALAQHIDQTISLQTSSSNSLPLLELVLVSATYKKVSILELGCGCGTVGIALAQSIPDCDVLLTDLPEVEDLVAANIARMRPAISSKVAFEALDWLAPLPENIASRTFDLIVVSECTYNADTLQALATTLLNLTVRSPKAVIVLSTKTRHSSEAAFFEMAKGVGLVMDGNLRMELPGIPGDGYGDFATDVGVFVFRGKDHRLSLSPANSEGEVPKSSRAARRRKDDGSRSRSR